MMPLPCCSHHDRMDLAVMQLLGVREGIMHATVSPQSAKPYKLTGLTKLTFGLSWISIWGD